jgi:2-polyprenyl-3-methyl-5-hydroxy-6-metoxy-1,4-benzoquinol methylase
LSKVEKCPLCGDTHFDEVDHISKARLRSLYLKEYNTDIGHLVTEDLSLYQCSNCDLKFFDPSFTGDQNFYRDLQKFDWYYKDDKLEYHYAKDFIKKNNSVLEIGSGKGAFSKLLATKKYMGLEFSEGASELAALEGIEVRSQSIEDHAVLNHEKYDVVCSFQVIEHTSDPKSFMQASVDCLKPGGKLILAVPCEDSFLCYIQDFALNMPPHHVTKWSLSTLKHLESQFGVKVVDIYQEPLNEFHIPWFLTSMFGYLLNRLLGIKHSLATKPSHWFSHSLAKFLANRFSKYLPKSYQPYGHTVIVVYEKYAQPK